jgi:hypothetical protein
MYVEEDVSGYTLLLAENDLFENALVIDDIDTCIYQPATSLSHNKTYFWKVKAKTIYGGEIECNQSYFRFITGTGTTYDQNPVPVKMKSHCYPNPFNPDLQQLAVRFSAPGTDLCITRIYDLSGIQVRQIKERVSATGSEHVILLGRNK